VSTGSEYQEYFLGGKSGWCVGLPTLSPSHANCLEICQPQLSGTLRACPSLFRDCCTFTILQHAQQHNNTTTQHHMLQDLTTSVTLL